MASSLIHLAVAKKVLESINVDNEKHYYLGAIAPDIAKKVGIGRNRSHFIKDGENTDTPNVIRFLNKYKKYLTNSYELGYYIHLLTDVLWFDEFLPNFVKDGCLVSKMGELIHFAEDELLEILYDDYSNLNPQLIEHYNLDLSLFYEKFDFPKSYITEVSEEYFQDVVDKLGAYCIKECNSNFVLQLENVIHFIEYACVYCLDELEKLNYQY